MNYTSIYRAIVARRGFPIDPPSAVIMRRDAGLIWMETARADLGAAREAHIRDAAIMATFARRARADIPPACRIETEVKG